MKRSGLGPQVFLLWRGPKKQVLLVLQVQQQQQLGLGSSQVLQPRQAASQILCDPVSPPKA